MPPLCIDARQKRYKFINNNGYVEDPVALFTLHKNEVYWNEKEKEIFLEKLLMFGKNFEIIASYLEKKVRTCYLIYFRATFEFYNNSILITESARLYRILLFNKEKG